MSKVRKNAKSKTAHAAASIASPGLAPGRLPARGGGVSPDALHVSAFLAFHERNYTGALEQLGRLIREQPNRPEVFLDLGVVHWHMGQADQAGAAFKRASEIAPGLADAHYNVATVCQVRGRLAEAIQGFRTAITLEPGLGWHKISNALARWLGRQQSLILGRRTWQISGRETHAARYLEEGRGLAERGQIGEAQVAGHRARLLAPELPEVAAFLARLALRQSNLTETVALCEAALKRHQGHRGLLTVLAEALIAQSQADAAMKCLRAVLKEPAPTNAGEAAHAHWLMGQALGELGRLEEAVTAYRTAIGVQPELGVAHHALGAALQLLERNDEALAAFRRAAQLVPGDPRMSSDLGVLLTRMGRFLEAIEAFEAAVAIDPGYLPARLNIADPLRRAGRLDQAIARLRALVIDEPTLAAAHDQLAGLLALSGEIEEAIACMDRAVTLDPTIAALFDKRGVFLASAKRFEDALASFRQALALNPNSVAVYTNLATLFSAGGFVNEAIANIERAIALDSKAGHLHSFLGVQYLTKRNMKRALEEFQRSRHLDPDSSAPHSNFLASILYDQSHTAEKIFKEHVAFGRYWEPPLAVRCIPHPRPVEAADRRLRIGYLSSGFRYHVSRQEILPLLRLHHRDRFHIQLYAQVSQPDEVTYQMKELADGLVYIHELTDDQAAERIRADGIDILVHTMGHFSDNRILICARKPAPIQVLYLCQSPTTGMASVDYIIGDRWLDDGGRMQACATERVVCLDGGFQVTEYDLEVPIAAVPAMQRGEGVTFGSFNNPIKINDRTVALWTQVLKAVPGSRMLIKGVALHLADMSAALKAEFQRHGVDEDRIVITPWFAEYRDHLDAHNLVDIVLDTTPFTGGRTTQDALWMGVPVVSLIGEGVHGRLSYSHLSRVGLGALCVRSEQEFVATAVALAGDTQRLAEYRQCLRSRMQASPMMDFQRHVDELEDAYRMMWRRWIKETPGDATA